MDHLPRCGVCKVTHWHYPHIIANFAAEARDMQDVEPFDGWLRFYEPDTDENSPFYGVEHSEFYYNRQVYEYLAHPLWEDIGSEGLLTKVLYANYEEGFAVLEMFGVWNDLLQNDFKLFAENCLTYFTDQGIHKFALIMENVLNIYLDTDDYYEAMAEELDEGWIALLRTRAHVKEELETAGLSQYLYWSPTLDALQWRKMKPAQLYLLIQAEMEKMLPG